MLQCMLQCDETKKICFPLNCQPLWQNPVVGAGNTQSNHNGGVVHHRLEGHSPGPWLLPQLVVGAASDRCLSF